MSQMIQLTDKSILLAPKQLITILFQTRQLLRTWKSRLICEPKELIIIGEPKELTRSAPKWLISPVRSDSLWFPSGSLQFFFFFTKPDTCLWLKSWIVLVSRLIRHSTVIRAKRSDALKSYNSEHNSAQCGVIPPIVWVRFCWCRSR